MEISGRGIPVVEMFQISNLKQIGNLKREIGNEAARTPRLSDFQFGFLSTFPFV
jgi:hypothetical protein